MQNYFLSIKQWRKNAHKHIEIHFLKCKISGNLDTSLVLFLPGGRVLHRPVLRLPVHLPAVPNPGDNCSGLSPSLRSHPHPSSAPSWEQWPQQPQDDHPATCDTGMGLEPSGFAEERGLRDPVPFQNRGCLLFGGSCIVAYWGAGPPEKCN